MGISAEQRKKLPKSDFGVPSKAKSAEGKAAPGSYPIDTPGRARSALSRVAQHGSPAEQASVRRRVAKKYPSIDVTTPKKKDKGK